MASRVSKITAALYSTSGLTRVSKITASARVIPPAILRISSFKLTAYVQDELTPIRVSSLHANAWGSLDQGLYLSGDLFGSNEVFTPVSFTSTFQPVSPPVPDVEVNPYRADVPNVDQQRIMREQHNLVQAGDSTFHWGVLTEISATALYNLGSVGRFYHDEFGIAIARYVKFTKMVETVAKAVPVGLNRKLNQPWVVTNQLELSDASSVMGVACPYNELIYSGSWFGWVIVDGFVPAEMDISLDNSSFEWATEYGWSETGKVKPGVDGPSLGTRFTTTKVPNLKPGEFLVKVNPLSLARLAGLITTQLGPLTTQVAGLVTQVNSLTVTVETHTQQIGQLQSQVVGLDNRITSESEAVARQLASMRALIPDVDYKSYVDGQIEMLTIQMNNQNTIIGQTANNALARVNELELKFEAQSTTALQNQIDALNDSMGGLTNRLVGFDTSIDTNALTAGQVLVSVDAGLTPGGTQLYTFQPVDLAISSLIDVDLSTAPADGDALCWNTTLGVWEPVAVSGGGGGISEAPIDGVQYARKNGAWDPVAGGGGGTQYIRGGTGMSGEVISSSAFASKGIIFKPDVDMTFDALHAMLDSASTGDTFRAEIWSLASITITGDRQPPTAFSLGSKLADSGNIVITNNGKLSMNFPLTSPASLVAGTYYLLAVIFTNAASGTSVLPIGATAAYIWNLNAPGLTVYGAQQFNTIGLTAGQTPTTIGGGSYYIWPSGTIP